MAESSSIRAGRAYVELVTDNKALEKSLDTASQRLNSWGDSVTSVGLKTMAVGSAIVAPLAAAGKVFADAGDAIQDASDRTGVAVDQLSALKYAAEQSASSFEALEGGLKKTTALFASAKMGSEEAVGTLDALGVKLADLERMTPDQRFLTFVEALSRIQDPALRAARAVEVFGKSGTDLLPMIDKGAKGINDLTDRARRLGLVWSKEDAKAAAELSDATDDLVAILKHFAATVGKALAPALKKSAEWMASMIQGVTRWVDTHREAIVVAYDAATAVVKLGAGLVALGYAMKAVGAAAGVMAAIVGTIGVAWAGVLAAVAGLGAYLLAGTETGRQALAALAGYFANLASIATTTFKGIIDAMKAGDWAMAMKILWAGLYAAWLAGIEPLRVAWEKFKAGFVSVAVGAFNGMLAAWEIARNALTESWIKTTSFLADVWARLQASVSKGWESLMALTTKALIKLNPNMSDADKEMAYANIEKDKVFNQAQADDKRDAKLKENERKRQADLEAEAKRSNAALAKIGEDYNRVDQAAKDLAQKEIDRAKFLSKAAVATLEDYTSYAAKKAAREAEQKGPQFVPPDIKGAGDAIAKATARGTFNAAALASVQTSRPLDAIKKATQDTAKNTSDLVKKLGQGVLNAFM